MQWKRVPDSWCRETERTAAIVRGDPGNDKQVSIGRAKIRRRGMRGEKFEKVGRLSIVKRFEGN